MQMYSPFVVLVLILRHVYTQGQRLHPHQVHQISWDALVKVEQAAEYQRRQVHDDGTRWQVPENLREAAKHPPREDKHGRSLKSLLCYCVCPLLLVFAVVVAIAAAFGVLQSPSGDSTSSPNTDVNNREIFMEQYNPNLVEASSPIRRRRSASEWTMNPWEDRLMPTATEDSLLIPTDLKHMTPSNSYFDAAVRETSAAGSASPVEIRRNVCIRASSKSLFWSPEVNTKHSEVHHNCDVLIHCCHFLPVDPSFENSIIARAESSRGELPTARNGNLPMRILLGVHVGDDNAFQKLLFNLSGERINFLKGIIQIARMGRFSGVRLWVPRQGNATSGFGDRLIGLSRTVAKKLRRFNCTFGFFLPQGILFKQRGVTTSELEKTLDAPHSLLVYPEFPAFGNTSVSTAVTWPTPEEVLAHAAVATGAMRNIKSICYLPPPPVAIQARLAEPCDPSKTQLVSRLTFLTLPMLSDVCRTLRLDDSWMSSARKDHTFACKENFVVLYQTPRQRRQFSDDLFAVSPLTTCIASFVDLEGLPGACHEIYSGFAEPE